VTLEQIKYQNPSSYIKYLTYILFSYLLFIFVIALFGKGFSALGSLGIVLLSCGLAIFYAMHKAQNIIFKRIDYFLVWIILMIQSLIGIIHFQNIINPEYFSTNVLGVDIEGGTYPWDTMYFGFLIDQIAEYRIDNGYFSIDFFTAAWQKNYFLAYLISGLFYYGDAYVLNFMAINILSIFYSGMVLALIANKVFGYLDINKRRIIFYLTILQPLAWIPSHTMRDIFGAFLVLLSVALLYFSVSKIQKAVFSILSLGLVFQHRSAYLISIAGTIVLRNFSQVWRQKGSGVFVILILVLFFYFFLSTNVSQILIGLFSQSQESSLLSGVNGILFLEHILKLIVGPFPWTQYIDGSVVGYPAFYFSTMTLQAAWHLTILYFLFRNIKKIFASKELRNYFYAILLFAVPAMFSLGGHNIYLLPSAMLSLVFLHIVPWTRFMLTYVSSVCLYISASATMFLLLKV